jgi:hypothetical protein
MAFILWAYIFPTPLGRGRVRGHIIDRNAMMRSSFEPSPDLSQRERDMFVVSPKGRGICLLCLPRERDMLVVSPKGRGIC